MGEARVELPEIFVPAQRPSRDDLNSSPATPQISFPREIATATPAELETHDKEALLLVGERGVPDPYGAFSLLENWLRFPKQSKETVATLAENPGEQHELHIQRAAEYLVTLRLMHIDPPPPRERPEDRQPDRNLAYYQRFDFFRDIAHLTERNPGEPIHSKRLRAARIGIFASMLYAHENGLQITIPSRVHFRAARRPGNMVHKPIVDDETP
jgi:hypothetical protein